MQENTFFPALEEGVTPSSDVVMVMLFTETGELVMLTSGDISGDVLIDGDGTLALATGAMFIVSAWKVWGVFRESSHTF